MAEHEEHLILLSLIGAIDPNNSLPSEPGSMVGVTVKINQIILDILLEQITEGP